MRWGCTRARSVAWADGVDARYAGAVFVTPPVDGWTFAMCARGNALADPLTPRFAAWLAELSSRLATVHYSATDRVFELHAWARASGGTIDRAYCYLGESGMVHIDTGSRTAEEIDLGLGSPPDTDGWLEDTPDEDDVMRLAAQWSIDPTTLDALPVTTRGLLGETPADISCSVHGPW